MKDDAQIYGRWDWRKAVELNREALMKIVAGLLAMIALPSGGLPCVLPAHMRTAVLRILLPAESAARRLIYILARDMDVKAPLTTSSSVDFSRLAAATSGERVPAFGLFDSEKRFNEAPVAQCNGSTPHIRFFDRCDMPIAQAEIYIDPVASSSQIITRLRALDGAMADFPKQARRLALQIKRRVLNGVAGVVQRLIRPMRPGFPPGRRGDKAEPIDEILLNCDALAKENFP